jgi:hypothetical protein
MYGFNNTTFSAYIAFCKENRDEVKAANPNAVFGDMGRLLLARWNEMSAKERSVYTNPRDNSQQNDENVHIEAEIPSEVGLRRSSRLRNKRMGVDFWGLKTKM